MNAPVSFLDTNKLEFLNFIVDYSTLRDDLELFSPHFSKELQSIPILAELLLCHLHRNLVRIYCFNFYALRPIKLVRSLPVK